MNAQSFGANHFVIFYFLIYWNTGQCIDVFSAWIIKLSHVFQEMSLDQVQKKCTRDHNQNLLSKFSPFELSVYAFDLVSKPIEVEAILTIWEIQIFFSHL